MLLAQQLPVVAGKWRCQDTFTGLLDGERDGCHGTLVCVPAAKWGGG